MNLRGGVRRRRGVRLMGSSRVILQDVIVSYIVVLVITDLSYVQLEYSSNFFHVLPFARSFRLATYIS